MSLFGPNSPAARIKRAKNAIREGLAAISHCQAYHGSGELEVIRGVQSELIKMFQAVYKELP